MHGDQQFVRRRIFRHLVPTVTGAPDVRTEACNQQKAAGVIAAGGPYGVHKNLIDPIGLHITFSVR